jgi:hypothetical protein
MGLTICISFQSEMIILSIFLWLSNFLIFCSKLATVVFTLRFSIILVTLDTTICSTNNTHTSPGYHFVWSKRFCFYICLITRTNQIMLVIQLTLDTGEAFPYDTCHPLCSKYLDMHSTKYHMKVNVSDAGKYVCQCWERFVRQIFCAAYLVKYHYRNHHCQQWTTKDQ